MINEKIICNKSDLAAIADAVRTITGSTQTYYPFELASHVVLTQLSALNVTYDNDGNVTLNINNGGM